MFIDEGIESKFCQFPAVSGVLYPSKRQERLGQADTGHPGIAYGPGNLVIG